MTATGGAAGGTYGIEALTQGNGGVAVEAAGAVSAGVQFGIFADSYGTGDVSVITDSGTVINSGGSGIFAIDQDPTIAALANSTITVTAHGTINSGTTNNLNGAVPSGIVAGYTGNNTDFHNVPNANVNGTVVVNNYANITAAAGYGIEAYNEGQGDVTVNDFAGTSISGAQFGIGTYSMSGGNVAVSMSTGDSITSGGIGIVALDEAASVSSSKTITVTAHGTINAASGIEAGYVLAGSAVIEPNVAGSVTVNSDATIVASGDYGIDAFNWGTGNVTVSAGTGSSITASNATGEGINAAAIDGGDVSVTNDGVLSARTGISAFASGAGNVSVVNNGQVTGFTGIDVTQNNPGATGSTTITNTDSVQGSGAAIAIAENATGAAEIDNTGTIGSSSLSFAIDESGGNLVINNNDHGVIDGSITAANTTFTNAQGATWNAGGVSEFGVASATGVVASTIDNSGTMNLASASISGASGLTITNETGGVINGVSGSSFITGAAITNAGTIEATTGGTLTIDPAPLTNYRNAGSHQRRHTEAVEHRGR